MVLKLFYFPWMIILSIEFGLWRSPISFLALVTYGGGSTNYVTIRWYLSSLGHHKRKFANVISCWYEDFMCIVILFYFCNTLWALNYNHVESKSSSHSQFQIAYSHFQETYSHFCKSSMCFQLAHIYKKKIGCWQW